MKHISVTFVMALLMVLLGAQTIQETLAQIEATQKELAENKIIFEQKIAELRATNPLFATQSAFESDVEYLGRYSKASPQIDRMRQQYLSDPMKRLTKLRASYFVTDNIAVELGRYDSNLEQYPVTINHLEYQKERYEVVMNIPRATAKLLTENWSRVIKKGGLTIDVGDKIGLAIVHLKDPVSGEVMDFSFEPMLDLRNPIESVSFSPDGKFLATGSGFGKAHIFSLETGMQVMEFQHWVDGVPSVSFSLDGKFLATGSYDGRARIFNLETGKQVMEFQHGGGVESVSISPNGKFLATGCGDKKARIFNIETGKQVMEFQHGGGVNSVSFSPDGKFLATGSSVRKKYVIGKAHIFNLETGKQVMEFQHKKGYWESEYKIDANVNSVSYSPDGKFLATVCNDGKARIFNLKTGKKVMEFQHGGGVNSVSFSPDGKFLATGCGDKKARIFNIETGKVVFQQTQENEVASVSFSPDGLYLAANDKIYRTLLGLKSIDAPPTISRPPVLTASISLSEPSGNQILDALEKGNIRLKVANSGEGTAEGLTVKLTPQLLKGLSYSNAYIAEIQAGKSIEIDIPLEAYIEVEDGTHTLAISFEEANGFPPNPLNLTFETRAFRKPVVQIADIGIDDNNKNGKIEAGEMIELTLRMKNNGEGTASGAYALFYAGENVFITDKYPKTQSIGDLQSGQSKDLKLEIFINERCANEIPLYADLTEATGLAGVSKLRIPITKSDQVRPITSVVVSGINSSFTQSEESSLQIDVERNIPIAVRENNDDFAVIFGVEIYAGSIPRALYALRDATWFREYAQKAFGIPEQNIYFRSNENVTKNEFNKVFGKGGWLDKRALPNSRVYVFFSGHGIPSTTDKSAYLLPYDGDPNYAGLTAYPLSSVYSGLGALKSSHNTVFLDACFTGISRENQALYAISRPVYISIDKSPVPENVSVLSAADWNQMSNAWPEKKHGLFTYFLLKGMQGSADTDLDHKITIGDLFSFLSKELPIQAGRLDKEQNPQISSTQSNNILLEYK